LHAPPGVAETVDWTQALLALGRQELDPNIVAETLGSIVKDYQPLAAGMRAALPHVDRFVAGHDLRSLDALADVVGSIRTRHQRT